MDSHARLGRKENERFILERADVQRLEPAERVLGMHRDDERVLGKIGEINGRLLERGRRAEETDIDFSVRDCRYLLLRRHLAKGYRHERIRSEEHTSELQH